MRAFFPTVFLGTALSIAALGAAGGSPAAAELSAAERTELERLLAGLSFDPGPVDGEIDDETRAAIRGYQEFAALSRTANRARPCSASCARSPTPSPR